MQQYVSHTATWEVLQPVGKGRCVCVSVDLVELKLDI